MFTTSTFPSLIFKYWSTESIVRNEGTALTETRNRICSTQLDVVLQFNSHDGMSVTKNGKER